MALAEEGKQGKHPATALKRWGRSARGVEKGNKEQVLPPCKQREGSGEEPGQTAGAVPAAGAGRSRRRCRRCRGRGAQRPPGDAPCPGRCSPAALAALSAFPGSPGAFPPPLPPAGYLAAPVPALPRVAPGTGACSAPSPGSAAPLPLRRASAARPGRTRERSRDGTHAKHGPYGASCAHPPQPPRAGGLGGGGGLGDGKERGWRRS